MTDFTPAASQLRSGDLIFTRSQSLTSKGVMRLSQVADALDRSLPRHPTYSHVMLVISPRLLIHAHPLSARINGRTEPGGVVSPRFRAILADRPWPRHLRRRKPRATRSVRRCKHKLKTAVEKEKANCWPRCPRTVGLKIGRRRIKCHANLLRPRNSRLTRYRH